MILPQNDFVSPSLTVEEKDIYSFHDIKSLNISLGTKPKQPSECLVSKYFNRSCLNIWLPSYSFLVQLTSV